MAFSITDLNNSLNADKRITGFDGFSASPNNLAITASVHGISVSLSLEDFIVCYMMAEKCTNKEEALSRLVTGLASEKIYTVLSQLDKVADSLQL